VVNGTIPQTASFIKIGTVTIGTTIKLDIQTADAISTWD
jgi:hypothetical protein